MISIYREMDPCEPTPGGDVGGDVQVGESWCRRFTHPVTEGEHAVVTVYFYLSEVDGVKEMTRQIEYLLCRDPDDPGGTEIWADQYDNEVRVSDSELTEGAAKRLCGELNHPASWYPSWNGEPFNSSRPFTRFGWTFVAVVDRDAGTCMDCDRRIMLVEFDQGEEEGPARHHNYVRYLRKHAHVDGTPGHGYLDNVSPRPTCPECGGFDLRYDDQAYGTEVTCGTCGHTAWHDRGD